jgi:hypothetical protein
MKYTVTATGVQNRGTKTQEIEIEEFENSAGELVLVTNRWGNTLLKAKVNIPEQWQGKIEEDELIMEADSDGHYLCGEATPKGKKKSQRAVLSEKAGSAYRELADALIEREHIICGVKDNLYRQINLEWEEKNILIPDGMIKVRFSHSEADGWVQVYKDADGRLLRNPKIEGEKERVAWMIAENYDEAVQAYEHEKAEKNNREKARLNEWIEIAEKQEQILSEAELEEKAIEHDNLYNEGGEGYNPYRDQVSLEDYNSYKQQLEAL